MLSENKECTRWGTAQDIGLDRVISVSVLRNRRVNRLFNELDDHILDGSVTDNHVLTLMKTIAVCYSKVRVHHLTREANEKR